MGDGQEAGGGERKGRPHNRGKDYATIVDFVILPS